MLKKLLALMVVLCCPFSGVLAKEQPNILFIITDDMYPWQMNFMPEGEGKNYTPNLDRLAQEGTVMRNQYVSSPVCTPSRYSVMTGRYASRSMAPGFLKTTENFGQTHVQWNSFVDSERENTVENHLSDAGYRTGFVGKDHSIWTPGRKRLGLDSDPDDVEVREIMHANAEASHKAIKAAGFEYVSRVYHNNPDFNGSRKLATHNQDWITEGALEFLQQDDERPFFLYFATTVPHGPTQPERSWKSDRRATPVGWLEQVPEVQPSADSIAQRARKHGVEGRETIIWIDDAIGALLTKLEQAGELENTVIFFFNDHGQSAKGSLYQGGTYNPSFVWRSGGWPAGNESHAIVSNIDLPATILDLAGAPDLGDMDGRSFREVLEGEKDQHRNSLYFELGYTRGVLKEGYKYIALRYPEKVANLTLEERQAALDNLNNSLRARGRGIHNEDPTKPFGHMMAIPGGHDAGRAAQDLHPNYFDTDQLYDLNEDPGEKANLWDDESLVERQKAMKELLESYLESLPGEFPLAP